jgi:hypothetical protein
LIHTGESKSGRTSVRRTGIRAGRVRLPRIARMLGLLAPLLVVVGGCERGEPEWEPIFNGRDLTGWTPKIRGYPLGEDPMGTFRVEDGLLTVGYERYGEFGGRFGHLFFDEPLSHYRLLVEYRFIGEQASGGEDWALRNSGVMVHAQAPETMGLDQDFPISLEAQFLGGNGVDDRPTANLCTPGTEVEMEGRLVEQHCIESTSPTFHGEDWVTVELLVIEDSLIVHSVGGTPVIQYQKPTIGGGVVSGFDPAVKTDGTPLTGGWIALQSESHPIQFRRILLQRLEEPPR